MICPSSISIDADHQMGRIPKPRRTELDQDLLSPRNDTPYSNSHLVLLKPGLATQRTLGSAHIFLQLFSELFVMPYCHQLPARDNDSISSSAIIIGFVFISFHISQARDPTLFRQLPPHEAV